MEIIHSHFKIYKPFGMLSQFTSGEPRQSRNKRFLTELYNFPEGVMPIGRLDEKSEGLLLLTTDGGLSNRINGTGVEKEYLVQVDGCITREAILTLKAGVKIGVFGKQYTTKPCMVYPEVLLDYLEAPSPKLRIGVHRPTSWIRVVITEGKFRQIRKMTAAVGYPTVRLVRIRIGSITLENMPVSAVFPMPEIPLG